MTKWFFAIGVVLLVVAAGLFVYQEKWSATHTVSPEATSTIIVSHCDNDAKLCPDGSTVLRSGPQCEFAACPSMFGEAREWQNRKDPKSDISFKYPATLGSSYVTASIWPPAISVTDGAQACATTSDAQSVPGPTLSEQTFNGEMFCVWQQDEGAAGSTYREFRISFVKDEKTYVLGFTVQLPQCMNYDGAEQSVCQAAQRAFSPVELAFGIRSTIAP